MVVFYSKKALAIDIDSASKQKGHSRFQNK